MRRRHDDLARYTWDQATILGMHTSQAFNALGFNPSTVRRWASAGHIKPVGRGPNGHVLYRLDDVISASRRERRQPGRRARIATL